MEYCKIEILKSTRIKFHALQYWQEINTKYNWKSVQATYKKFQSKNKLHCFILNKFVTHFKDNI